MAFVEFGSKSRVRWIVVSALATAGHLGALGLCTQRTTSAPEAGPTLVQVALLAEPVETATDVDAPNDRGDGDTMPAAAEPARDPGAKARANAAARTDDERAAVAHDDAAHDDGAQEALHLAARDDVHAADGALPSTGPATSESSGNGDGAGSGATAGGSAAAGDPRRGGTARRASIRAQLLAHSRRCSDLFPYAATSDAATVVLSVGVSPTGHSQTARVVRASPAGQGFADAGRACAKRFVFSPARSSHGAPTASEAIVKLRFTRSG